MKKVILVLMLVAMVIVLCSCKVGNRQVGVDTVQTFDRFKIIFGNEVIEGRVATWRDFEDSDVIQITNSDGVVYLTHYMNVLMWRNKR